MLVNIEITQAVVLLTRSTDKVFLSTKKPPSFVEESECLVLRFDASYDTGAKYVKDIFGIEPEVINGR